MNLGKGRNITTLTTTSLGHTLNLHCMYKCTCLQKHLLVNNCAQKKSFPVLHILMYSLPLKLENVLLSYLYMYYLKN